MVVQTLQRRKRRALLGWLQHPASHQWPWPPELPALLTLRSRSDRRRRGSDLRSGYPAGARRPGHGPAAALGRGTDSEVPGGSIATAVPGSDSDMAWVPAAPYSSPRRFQSRGRAERSLPVESYSVPWLDKDICAEVSRNPDPDSKTGPLRVSSESSPASRAVSVCRCEAGKRRGAAESYSPLFEK